MFRTFRIWWWYLKAAVKRYYRQVLTLVLILTLLVVSLPTLARAFGPFYQDFVAPAQKPVLSEGLVGSVSVINPILADTEAERDLCQLVFRSLTKTDATGEVRGDLAYEFQVENNQDYLFKLRGDVYWHDGEKFSAEDVIYSIKIASDPSFNSPYYSTLKEVKTQKVDDYTVKIILKEPFAPFLTLTDFGIIPAHIPLTNYRPIGTGSFKVIESKDNYALLKGEKFNYLFRYYATHDLALTALKLGEIQALSNLSNQEAQDFRDFWPNMRVYEHTLGRRLMGLFFNFKNEKLADKSLRQALQLSTPKDKIITQVTDNRGQVAHSTLPLNSWVQAQENPRLRFNPDEARKVLDRGGWTVGEDGFRYKDGNPLVVTITTLDNRTYLQVLDLLKTSWEEVGVKVEKITVNNNQLRDNILPNFRYEVLLNLQEIPADPDQYAFWHSTQTNEGNITGVKNAKVDKAIEDGRKNLDRKVRTSRYLDFQRFLSDETPVISLYYPPYYYVVSDKVRGVDIAGLVLAVDRFNSISQWLVAKKYF